MTHPALASHPLLARLGLEGHPRLAPPGTPGAITSTNPATAQPIAAVRADTPESVERAMSASVEAFHRWRLTPAPVRGQVVRAIGESFRAHRQDLGRLVSLEVGKILAEGVGEIQEIIDIADFSLGLARQLPGATMPSERPGHRLLEQWLPLGPVGVITAFNFPAAVWGWNAMLAAICGDTVLWKPSLLAPLTALACQHLAQQAAAAAGHPGVFSLVIPPDDAGAEAIVTDRRLPLISATGSCAMGRRVGALVAQRLGRSLLELGGNNACIVHADADLDLALRGLLFSAVGTAGQRCTTTRRLIVHASIADRFLARLTDAYAQAAARIGDPLDPATLIGPLISPRALDAAFRAVEQAQAQGGTLLFGGHRAPPARDGNFFTPAIIRAPASNHLPVAATETFAPILYVFTYHSLDEALALHNSVDQGLSSALFTESLRASERFLAPHGSDCGLAYVNLGTSGAEIGGAFGGEKDTGGGRESGSDAWKTYMRRQTCCINGTGDFQLAQGIRFE